MHDARWILTKALSFTYALYSDHARAAPTQAYSLITPAEERLRPSLVIFPTSSTFASSSFTGPSWCRILLVSILYIQQNLEKCWTPR